jgi:hypothetical protein
VRKRRFRGDFIAYRLTAEGTIMAVEFLLEHTPAGGYYTPSMLMGARCVEQLSGSTPIRVGLAAAQGRTVRGGLASQRLTAFTLLGGLGQIRSPVPRQ